MSTLVKLNQALAHKGATVCMTGNDTMATEGFSDIL